MCVHWIFSSGIQLYFCCSSWRIIYVITIVFTNTIFAPVFMMREIRHLLLEISRWQSWRPKDQFILKFSKHNCILCFCLCMCFFVSVLLKQILNISNFCSYIRANMECVKSQLNVYKFFSFFFSVQSPESESTFNWLYDFQAVFTRENGSVRITVKIYWQFALWTSAIKLCGKLRQSVIINIVILLIIILLIIIMTVVVLILLVSLQKCIL